MKAYQIPHSGYSSSSLRVHLAAHPYWQAETEGQWQFPLQYLPGKSHDFRIGPHGVAQSQIVDDLISLSFFNYGFRNSEISKPTQ